MRVADQRVSSSFDDESILIGETKEPDPKTGQLASVTVRGTPEVLAMETVGYHWSWLELHELKFITQQKSVGEKSETLNKVLDRVKERLKKKEKCRKLFDQIDTNYVLANSVSIHDRNYDNEPFTNPIKPAETKSNRVDGRRQPSGFIVFNQNSFFFTAEIGGNNAREVLANSDLGRKNGFDFLNFEQLRELTVLHELMHINDTAGVYDNQGLSNPELNQLIRKNCF